MTKDQLTLLQKQCVHFAGSLGQLGTGLAKKLRQIYGIDNVIMSDILRPSQSIRDDGDLFEFLLLVYAGKQTLFLTFLNRTLPVRGHPGLQEPAGDHRQQLDRLDRAFQRAAERRRGAERSACDASEYRGSAQRARDRQAVRPQALRPQHHR